MISTSNNYGIVCRLRILHFFLIKVDFCKSEFYLIIFVFTFDIGQYTKASETSTCTENSALKIHVWPSAVICSDVGSLSL